MSLVGPRPHALVHDDEYGVLLEQYASRHQVKPGITGLAQVRGFRGPTPTPDRMQARIEQDIEYVKTWSLGLDLQILARTMFIVIFGGNAH
jgi:putative colanic acid biosynthesis UDP-glucose lipid carrier transferase